MRDRDKILGIALIIFGALFLLGRVMDVGQFAWPLFVLIPGIIMLAAAFLGKRDAAPLAVPGSIVTTIGLILFVLNATDHWEAWAYSWALIVAGVGAGSFLFGAITRDNARERDGLRTVYIGLTLFVVFGLFFELLIFGGFGGTLRWLIPLILIGAGVYMLFFRDPQSPLPWVTPGSSAPDTPRDYVGQQPPATPGAPPAGHAPAPRPDPAPPDRPASTTPVQRAPADGEQTGAPPSVPDAPLSDAPFSDAPLRDAPPPSEADEDSRH